MNLTPRSSITLASVALLLVIAPSLCRAVAATEPSPSTGGILVCLRGALLQDGDVNERRDLRLDAEFENGKWPRVYGHGMNIGDHFGFVEEAVVTSDAVRVKLSVQVEADPWIAGGEGRYEIDLKRNADGALKGTFKGVFNTVAVDGAAYGMMKPPRPIRIKDFRPLTPGEHPRLLFRRHELPALKEKLKTPFGQAFLGKAKAAAADPVCNGMLWQLTGDRQYADAAERIIGSYGDLAPEGGGGTGGVGHRFVAVALASDLCWDIWPEGFRKNLAERITNDLAVIQRRLQIAGANFDPCSNFYGPARGSAAIATLLLYGQPGPEPKKPASPDEMVAKGGLAAKLMAKTGKLDEYRALYPSMLAKWQVQHDEWAAMGGADWDMLNLFHKGFVHMNRTYRVGIGDGGFAAETGAYSAIGPRYPLFYATYYLRCFGRNPSAFPDITHHMSRRLMQCVFPQPAEPLRRDGFREAEPITMKINSIAGMTYGGVDWLATSFPLSPDEHKPALLWAWNYIRRVRPEDPATVTNILPDGGGHGTSLAHAFINYPLEMKAVHPKDGMPLTWQATTMGLYLFRNGWEGKDDFLAQVFGKCHRIGGWNHPNAGTFNLWGLGHQWATCNPDRLGFREQENVVLLPDDEIRGGNLGFRSHLDVAPDGSGSVTIDLDELYSGGKTGAAVPRKRGAPLTQTKAGGIVVDHSDRLVVKSFPLRDGFNNRLTENLAGGPIRGLRAFGFDYSGKSGAPCLMVVADKITGGKKKVWTWHIERDSAKAKKEAGEVKIDGNAFTISRGDAFLKATFVSPAGVRIARNRNEVVMTHSKAGTGGRFFEGFLDRIEASGEDPTAGDFLVVVTVQRKDAPTVRVDGSGPQPKVIVGSQTVRFDGQKIRFGASD